MKQSNTKCAVKHDHIKQPGQNLQVLSSQDTDEISHCLKKLVEKII